MALKRRKKPNGMADAFALLVLIASAASLSPQYDAAVNLTLNQMIVERRKESEKMVIPCAVSGVGPESDADSYSVGRGLFAPR